MNEAILVLVAVALTASQRFLFGRHGAWMSEAGACDRTAARVNIII
jgi:hypothetical protein